MDRSLFVGPDGEPIPAVTADEMRAVDRVAVEDVDLPLLSMMENAGRTLAGLVRERVDGDDGPVVVAAGSGGNGGGGLCAARHLRNRGVEVRLALDRPSEELTGAAATQFSAATAAGATVAEDPAAAVRDAPVVVDAVVGYGLSGALRGPAETLVAATEDADAVLSLDVPSGRDATTGEGPGAVVRPDATLTLALPKTGLAACDSALTLADIGIPAAVYRDAGIEVGSPVVGSYRTPLTRTE